MEMKVKELVKHALSLDDNVSVTNIRRAGGMTNLNYYVTIDSEDYIVRLPGHGTGELVNRRMEKANLEFATALGINPELMYFNVDSGMKITKKIKEAMTLTPELAKNKSMIEKVAKIFQTLHQTEKEMDNEFKLFELTNHYKKLVGEVNPFILEKFEMLDKDLVKLKKRFLYMKGITQVPCHIDPDHTNFLIDEQERVYLIDWEYSGMFDPLWDIAAFSLECEFTENEELTFLAAYFQRETKEEELERMLMHKIFQDYLWSLWTFYKEAQGDDFGSYGMLRLKRAKENMQLFHETFNRTEAG